MRKPKKTRARKENSLEGWANIIRESGEQERLRRAEALANRPAPIQWQSKSGIEVRIQEDGVNPDGLPLFHIEAPNGLTREELVAFGAFLTENFGTSG